MLFPLAALCFIALTYLALTDYLLLSAEGLGIKYSPWLNANLYGQLQISKRVTITHDNTWPE